MVLYKYKDFTEEDWKKLANECKVSNEYWANDAELVKKLEEENAKIKKSLEMHHEKLHRKFDL